MIERSKEEIQLLINDRVLELTREGLPPAEVGRLARAAHPFGVFAEMADLAKVRMAHPERQTTVWADNVLLRRRVIIDGEPVVEVTHAAESCGMSRAEFLQALARVENRHIGYSEGLAVTCEQRRISAIALGHGSIKPEPQRPARLS